MNELANADEVKNSNSKRDTAPKEKRLTFTFPHDKTNYLRWRVRFESQRENREEKKNMYSALAAIDLILDWLVDGWWW